DVSVECNPVSYAYATDEEMKEYLGIIPNGDVKPAKVEYYIQAEDAAGNLATHPTLGLKAPHVITVTPKDNGGNGGGPSTGGLGGFLASTTGIALILGIIVAIAAIAAALLLMKRRKRPTAATYQAGSGGNPQAGQDQWNQTGQYQQASWGESQGWRS
ncbi:MAG TPA: hypothetical protein VI893_04395, partial [Thermoplasmata archaeon]|nr:hypothetical protein [Thermoplasmata archaeon]